MNVIIILDMRHSDTHQYLRKDWLIVQPSKASSCYSQGGWLMRCDTMFNRKKKVVLSSNYQYSVFDNCWADFWRSLLQPYSFQDWWRPGIIHQQSMTSPLASWLHLSFLPQAAPHPAAAVQFSETDNRLNVIIHKDVLVQL